MTIITIKEQGTATAGHVVSIDGQEYPFTLADPFTEQEERRLEWYFEEHLTRPFVNQVKAGDAATSITTYGHALFDQVFHDRRAYARYHGALQQGLETLTFEIAGKAEFHRLHWEALKDPELPQPFALQSSFVRRNFQHQAILAQPRPSPTINLLVVTARPHGAGDVGYRTISRPLVGALRQAGLHVQVDILRPGTYAALERHLKEVQNRHGTGYYHVVHFDVHGALLTYAQYLAAQSPNALGGLGTLTYGARYGRPDLPAYEGLKAFLFLERADEGQADPLEAGELGALLLQHQVPIAILNACQSGKELGQRGLSPKSRTEPAPEPGATQMDVRETSLGSRLMGAGIQVVLAMSYSITVTAAERLMQRLYQELFAGTDLAAAICAGRRALYNSKDRRAYTNRTIDLEDWLLPVVYENQPQQLKTRDFTPAEEKEFYERQAARYPEPQVAYEFVGRDLDILSIERKLLGQNNLLLVHGMGGAGKTTLLHHLGYWWQTTGLVDQVFYFGYDQKAWTRQQIMDAIARQLLGEIDYLRRFQPLSPAAQQSFLSERLRAGSGDGKRHLLMLDNLESITGVRLAIQNTLDAPEQARVRDFLHSLIGGRTLVLLGSRGNEEWLAPGTFGANVYALPGLDPEAASNLADLVLQRYKVTKWRGDKDFARLLTLLEGYPLPLEIVLANLQRQTPTEIVEALEAGLKEIDTSKSSKTESLLACIDYSYGNLAEDSQELLLCLAPFTALVYQNALQQYTEQLKAQPALAHLPFDRWDAVLQEAVNWGLLAPHNDARGFLRLQPILPYFLRNRLQAQPDFRAAVETAFRALYDGLGGALHRLIKSKDPQERQRGLALVSLEFENLTTALELALQQRAVFFNPYEAIYSLLGEQSKHAQALHMSKHVLAARSSYTDVELSQDVALHFYLVVERTAMSALMLKHYAMAEHTYQEALGYARDLKGLNDEARASYSAILYHQLGMVAQEQRQWAQADDYYQQALTILSNVGDQYRCAHTYHNLGVVAQEQQQWAQAEDYYQQALAIFIDFDDRYNQAKIYHHLGRAAQGKQVWAQAEQYYHQALAIKIDLDDRYSQAPTYHQLGVVAQLQRQWARAEEYYQQAIVIFIDFGDRYSQAKTYHHLGVTVKSQRQWVQAREYLAQALAIFKEFKDEHSTAITVRTLAHLWQESNDEFLPDVVAQSLGSPLEEVVARFRQALADGDQPS
ncbi:MAG: tetratricopeptide repeat protein [Caldilineaceae bacterium]